ncbi:MAG TPA: hypothetical protein VFM02_02360, partial [Candidatus Paceibacterota bacterium]|nr:hypothetical protein [Candidatus Paceibacterota bacterium]
MPEPTNTPIEGEAKPQAPAPETKPQTPEAKPPVDVSAIDLEELKKLNPSVAKALLDAEEIKTKLNKYEKDQEASDRKKKEEEGKWQELANDNDAKRQEAETRLGEVQKKLDKFSGTIETILKEVEKTIPDDKKALIP